MTIIEIILLAIALAMDCFTVSIAGSIQHPTSNWKLILRSALFFGLFQGIMPLISWSIGVSFKTYIENFDHWIAFILLLYLGGKMIWENRKNTTKIIENNIFDSLKYLFLMSIAVSIGALSTGIIFIPYGQQIWLAISIIAATSFIFSILGIFIGNFYGKKVHLNVEFIGGIILICIGIKILIEHLLSE